MNGMAMAKKYAICVILFSFRWKKYYTHRILESVCSYSEWITVQISSSWNQKRISMMMMVLKRGHSARITWNSIEFCMTQRIIIFFIEWSTGRKIAQTHDNLTIQTFIDMCAIGQSANFLLNFMCTHSSVLLFHFFLGYTIRLLLLHFERRLILFLPHSSLQRGITKNQTWCDVI